MTKFNDLTGQRIGNLIALQKTDPYVCPKGTSRTTRWICLCDCGTETLALYPNLKKGIKKTCGKVDCPYHLLRMRKGYSPGQAGFRQAWGLYRRKALARGIAFQLSEEEAIEFFKRPCFYCGAPPGNKAKAKTKHGAALYSGLDKIDPKGGYVLGNIRPCCWPCNRMKSTMPNDDFMNHLRKIIEYQQRE